MLKHSLPKRCKTFNRTSMELKLTRQHEQMILQLPTFNRTSMELKPRGGS